MTAQHPQLAQARAEAGRGWTPIRISVAIALYNAGHSAKQVACLIGGVTRNAVIGKMNRGTTSGEIQITNERKASRAPTAPRPRVSRAAVNASRPRTERMPRSERAAKPAPAPVIDAQIPLEQRRTLDQLTDSCCHWPVGDPQSPDFFFCGATKPNDPQSPYCDAHRRRARNPDSGRRNAAWRGRR